MRTIGRLIGGLFFIALLLLVLLYLLHANGYTLPPQLDMLITSLEQRITPFLSFRKFAGLFVIVWLVLFVFLWFAAPNALGQKSGWNRLARRYRQRTSVTPPGGFAIGWGRVGNVTYRNALKVAVHRHGLMVQTALPFMLGSPDLQIPWRDIDKVTIRESLYRDNQWWFKLFEPLMGKTGDIFSPAFGDPYAHITLSSYPDQVLVLPWKEEMRAGIPEQVTIE